MYVNFCKGCKQGKLVRPEVFQKRLESGRWGKDAKAFLDPNKTQYLCLKCRPSKKKVLEAKIKAGQKQTKGTPKK